MKKSCVVITSVLCAIFCALAVFVRPVGVWNALCSLCAVSLFPPVYLLITKTTKDHRLWQNFMFCAIVFTVALVFFFHGNTIYDYTSRSPKLPGENAVTTEAAQPAASGRGTAPQPSESGIGEGVYVTPNGKRYHKNAECAGGSAQRTTLDDAASRGYTPCKKCCGMG